MSINHSQPFISLILKVLCCLIHSHCKVIFGERRYGVNFDRRIVSLTEGTHLTTKAFFEITYAVVVVETVELTTA